MTHRWTALVAVIALLLSTTAAFAQSRSASDDEQDEDRVRVSLGASLGFFADDPGGVNLGFEMPINVNRNFSIGPWATVGLADDFLLVFGSANFRYHFDVFESRKLRKLRPFLQGGMGVAYYDDDRTRDDDTGFLLNMGLGADYEITDHVILGSNMMFNTVPTFRPSRAFYWTWQFLSLRYRF
jgi:hypothetical protein